MKSLLSLMTISALAFGCSSHSTEESAQVKKVENFTYTASVTSVKVASSTELVCAPARVCMTLALRQSGPLDQILNDFYVGVTKEFAIEQQGKTLAASFYGFTYTADSQIGFTLMLDESSSVAFAAGQEYRIQYLGDLQQGPYSWEFPEELIGLN